MIVKVESTQEKKLYDLNCPVGYLPAAGDRVLIQTPGGGWWNFTITGRTWWFYGQVPPQVTLQATKAPDHAGPWW